MWDPAQYERFRSERQQPFHDLVARVRRKAGMRVVDLGCGTGETTAELHRTLAADATLGVDASAEMLAKAPPGVEGLRFERRRIEEWSGDSFDLVFSNAALHWVADHESLLPRLCRALAPAGQLAVQVPANDDHASHVTAAEIAREMGIAPRTSPVLPPERYAEVLHRAGMRDAHVWLQVYSHLLPSRDDVVEWVKGSLLTDYLGRLPADRHAEYLERYAAALRTRLPAERPYLYTYKRILLHARR